MILTAIFFSLVIKNPGGEEGEEDEEDEEKPRLATDEEYLHDQDSGRLDHTNLQYSLINALNLRINIIRKAYIQMYLSSKPKH